MAKLIVLATVLATAAAMLGGCGEEDAELLPGSTASEINANLDTVKRLSDEGDCVGAESAAQQVGEQVAALDDIDPKLKRALEKGAAKLNEVVEECDEEEREVAEPEDEAADEEEAPEEDQERGRQDGGKAQKGAGERGGREGRGPPARTPPSQSEKEPSPTPPAEAPPSQESPPSGGVEPATPVEEGEG